MFKVVPWFGLQGSIEHNVEQQGCKRYPGKVDECIIKITKSSQRGGELATRSLRNLGS